MAPICWTSAVSQPALSPRARRHCPTEIERARVVPVIEALAATLPAGDHPLYRHVQGQRRRAPRWTPAPRSSTTSGACAPTLSMARSCRRAWRPGRADEQPARPATPRSPERRGTPARGQPPDGAGRRRSPGSSIILDPGFGFGLARRGEPASAGAAGRAARAGAAAAGRHVAQVAYRPGAGDRRWRTGWRERRRRSRSAIAQGADIVRVHDVKQMARVARMADAVVRGWSEAQA